MIRLVLSIVFVLFVQVATVWPLATLRIVGIWVAPTALVLLLLVRKGISSKLAPNQTAGSDNDWDLTVGPGN